MRFRDWLTLGVAMSAGVLVYGVLTESKRLTLERRRLRLPGWPASRAGYRIAVLADLHIGHRYSVELAQRAVALAMQEEPDMVALLGDTVSRGFPDAPESAREVLEPLLMTEGGAVAVLGNHETGAIGRHFAAMLPEVGVTLLRNEAWRHDGIVWVGLDSARRNRHRPNVAMRAGRELAQEHGEPIVTLWHEPDWVDRLPDGAALMIAGHTHGGQFVFPWGHAPKKSKLGEKYLQGFFPDTPTPLYVSRGVGTTGPPSRFNCPPEVSLLTLEPLA